MDALPFRLTFRCNAGTVVEDRDLIAVRRFRGEEHDGPPPSRISANSMTDCILHQWLQAHRRQQEIRAVDVIGYLKVLSKAHLLQLQILSGLVELLFKRDQLL